MTKKLKIDKKEKEKVQIIWIKLMKSSKKKTQIKAKRVVYPTASLLALGKNQDRTKKTKKEET